MKKLISTILAVAMIVTMFTAMPAFAAKSYDAVNNSYSIDFNSTSDAGNAANYVTRDGDDMCYMLQYQKEPYIGSSLVIGGDASPLVADARKIRFDFDYKVDSESVAGAYMRTMSFKFGNVETYPLISCYRGSNTDVRFMINTTGAYAGFNVGSPLLYSFPLDTWVSMSLVFDLTNSTYDTYISGKKVAVGSPLKDTSGNLISSNGLTSVSICNDNDMQKLNTVYRDCKFYIDNIYATDTLTNGIIDFEDADSAINERLSTIGGSASITSTTDKNEKATSAVSLKYDGLGKNTSDVTVQSSYTLKNDDGLVNNTNAYVSFDFKIDGEYTKAGTFGSRFNPGRPTFAYLNLGTVGETTPLVAATYTREKYDDSTTVWEDWAKLPDTWEIGFANGRLNYVGSGVEIGRDEWVSITLALDMTAGTYDAYVDDKLVLTDLTIGNVTSGSKSMAGGTNLKRFNVNACTVSHYNSNNISTWGAYIDNISWGEIPSSASAVSASGAKLVKADGADAAAGEARTYTASLYNPNIAGEETYFAMRAVDANGEMKDLVFDKIFIPSGKSTITKEFKKIDEGNYGVKAFFFDLDTLKPYNNGMGSASSAIAE